MDNLHLINLEAEMCNEKGIEENFDQEDRREFVRFSVDFHLLFLDSKTGAEKEAQIRDVSAKGLGIITDEELNNDTILEMQIEVSDNEKPLYRRGKVVWSKQIEPNKYRIGISLENVDLIGISRILRAVYGPNWL